MTLRVHTTGGALAVGEARRHSRPDEASQYGGKLLTNTDIAAAVATNRAVPLASHSSVDSDLAPWFVATAVDFQTHTSFFFGVETLDPVTRFLMRQLRGVRR